MPSTNEIERPEEALAVAQRYHRRERPLSALVVAVVVALFLGTYLTASLIPAIAVAAVSLVVARAPALRPRGTIRLRTDADAASVVEEFAGPTPPVLAFQWGVADRVVRGDGAVTYETSYLFGLRSADVTVATRAEAAPDGTHRVDVEIEMNGEPWATYEAAIESTDGGTAVDVEYTSDRGFGLRYLPQHALAERYRDDALAAQGYQVIERDSRLR